MPPGRQMGPPAKPKNIKATFGRILKYLVGQNKLLLLLVLILVNAIFVFVVVTINLVISKVARRRT